VIRAILRLRYSSGGMLTTSIGDDMADSWSGLERSVEGTGERKVRENEEGGGVRR
jgi:hypothetical protein